MLTGVSYLILCQPWDPRGFCSVGVSTASFSVVIIGSLEGFFSLGGEA